MDIAKKYCKYINIFENATNLGQPKNTNLAVDLANGEYIVILHSDDILLPNFCSTLVPLLTSNEKLVLAVGERQETDESGAVKEITPFYNIDCIIPGEKQAKVFMMMSFLPCQVLFKKSAFIESGLINERHIVNLDGLLWFQMTLLGDVIYTKQNVSIYRIHHESTTSAYNKTINHMMEYYSTLSEMFKLAKGKPYLEHYFELAEKRVAILTLRYCHDVIKNKNYKLARQYLRLAQVFDPEIVNDTIYQLLAQCLESTEKEPIDIYWSLISDQQMKRPNSYDPPEGFIPL
jgi:glycosyltransferase involved in cell wall biosynthesis